MLDVEESVFDPQNGGAIVDSGSSFTYLVEPAFNALLAVVSQGAVCCGQVTSGVCFPGQTCCKVVGNAG